MKTEPTQDQFGNRVEIKHYADGTKKRIVFPESKYSPFEFLGDEYSRALLRENTKLKVYYKDSDSEATLQRDHYGRLFLFFYDEYHLSNGDDRRDYLWALVADESDADEFVKVARLSRLREPYIVYDGENWLVAHEFI